MIVPGAGGAGFIVGGGTTNISLTLAAGDVVVVVMQRSATGNPSVAGPGPQVWELTVQMTAQTNPAMFVIRDAVAASGTLVISNGGAGTPGFTFCYQVYSGAVVESIMNGPNVASGANPAVAPSPTTFFTVTQFNSVAVSGFSFNLGSGQLAFPPPARQQQLSSTNSYCISDITVATPGQAQIFQPYTVGNYLALGLVLAPSAVGGFTLSANPSSLTVNQASSGSTTISITPQGGFSGNVTLSVLSGLPTGVVAVFSPDPATTTSVLTLTASTSAVPGVYPLVIEGESGSLTDQLPFTLTVIPQTPPPVTIIPGAFATCVNAAVGGHVCTSTSFPVAVGDIVVIIVSSLGSGTATPSFSAVDTLGTMYNLLTPPQTVNVLVGRVTKAGTCTITLTRFAPGGGSANNLFQAAIQVYSNVGQSITYLGTTGASSAVPAQTVLTPVITGDVVVGGFYSNAVLGFASFPPSVFRGLASSAPYGVGIADNTALADGTLRAQMSHAGGTTFVQTVALKLTPGVFISGEGVAVAATLTLINN